MGLAPQRTHHDNARYTVRSKDVAHDIEDPAAKGARKLLSILATSSIRSATVGDDRLRHLQNHLAQLHGFERPRNLPLDRLEALHFPAEGARLCVGRPSTISPSLRPARERLD